MQSAQLIYLLDDIRYFLRIVGCIAFRPLCCFQDFWHLCNQTVLLGALLLKSLLSVAVYDCNTLLDDAHLKRFYRPMSEMLATVRHESRKTRDSMQYVKLCTVTLL